MMTMSNTLNKIIIFTVGAAIGSAVTWKLVKTKYEKIAQEEINSVKEVFSRREKARTEKEAEKKEVEEYAAKVKECGYSSDDEEEVDEDMNKPEVISPREFDDNGYKTVSLEYYEDGVLLNEQGKVIKDASELIGDIDPSEHFGEYEDDSVFVRNDRLKTDYEILRHEGCYSERY